MTNYAYFSEGIETSYEQGDEDDTKINLISKSNIDGAIKLTCHE